MGTLVMKFGGLSVGTTTALTQVLSIILHERDKWENLLIVVSALEGVTDNLIEATRLAQISNRRGYRRIVATLRTRHLALIEHLSLGTSEQKAIRADVDRLLFEMIDQLQSVADNPSEELQQQTIDQIIGVGERMSARIVASIIRASDVRAVAIDADGLIVTDDNFGNATPDIDASCQRITQNLLPMLERSIVPVITGYVGATPDRRLTTLGRGGSDYTATVVGICAQADEVWLWTDVDGMMTTDPRDVDDARAIQVMSYEEVGEMAYFGARVLHPRMVGPLQEAKIPLRVKNVFKPQQPGTLIFDTNNRHHAHFPKAVTLIHGIGLRADYSGPLTDISQLVNDLLRLEAGSHAEAMITSQSATRTFLSFVVPTSSGPGALRKALEELSTALEGKRPEWQVQQVSIVTIVGSKINTKPSIMAKILQELDDISILGLSPGPSECSLSIVVNPEDSYSTQTRIHSFLIASQGGDA
jgi:aspartokinase/homoserine dehydrogenase 1